MINIREETVKHVDEILNILGITYENGYKDRGGFIMGPSPCHGGDNPTGFSVKVFSDHVVWSCWTHHCEEEHGKDLVGLIKAVKKINHKGAIAIIEDIINKTGVSFISNQIKARKEEQNHWEKHVTQKEVDSIELTSPERYCQERAFDLSVSQSYAMGICSHGALSGRFVVPIRNVNKKIIAYSGRLISFSKESKDSKWKHHPRGFPKGINLFNVERLDKSKSEFVILTEGPFDALKFEMAGIPNAVAILGDNICNGQIEILNRLYFTDVVIALDNDEAGKKGTERAARKLEKNRFRLWTIKAEGIKDWGEATVEQIREAIKNKKRL